MSGTKRSRFKTQKRPFFENYDWIHGNSVTVLSKEIQNEWNSMCWKEGYLKGIDLHSSNTYWYSISKWFRLRLLNDLDRIFQIKAEQEWKSWKEKKNLKNEENEVVIIQISSFWDWLKNMVYLFNPLRRKSWFKWVDVSAGIRRSFFNVNFKSIFGPITS